MDDRDEVARLLGRGGWALDDVQARHAANPDTFWLPSDEQLAALAEGTTVRLIFALVDQADRVRDSLPPYRDNGSPNLVVHCERMWLWVERVLGDDLIGILQNRPTATHTRLVPGARVRFRRRDVIDLDLEPKVAMRAELDAMAELGFPMLDEEACLAAEDPRRMPTIASSQAEVCAKAGVKPERPWAFSRCLIGCCVQPGTWPIFATRGEPRPDRRDSGWTVWAGDPDMGVAAKKHGFDIVEVGQLFERHRAAWNHLALPPGWAFVLGDNGYVDVYQDPEILK